MYSVCMLQVAITTPSRSTPFHKTLGEEEGRVARALAGGHASSIASAVMKIPDVKKELHIHFLNSINRECTELCKKDTLFRGIPADQIASFRWEVFMDELESKSPLLLDILTVAATRVINRNQGSPKTNKYPGMVTAAAVLLKQRNREMVAIPSVVSLLMYRGYCQKQVCTLYILELKISIHKAFIFQLYGRLNHMNMCVSYCTTLRLVQKISTLNSAPLKQWIKEDIILKFWGDNVDKMQKVRDLRSDHKGDMLHMFSILVARSRTPAPHLPLEGQLSKLSEVPEEFFLPTSEDVCKVKSNLVIIVSRVLTKYFSQLAPFSKVVQKHILHLYSAEMSNKFDVFVLDILMKNETKNKDMIKIMQTIQDYLGESYNVDHPVLCGGDQLTCERQLGAKRHMMCGNTAWDKLDLLQPVVEDWHCLVSLVGVSIIHSFACNIELRRVNSPTS